MGVIPLAKGVGCAGAIAVFYRTGSHQVGVRGICKDAIATEDNQIATARMGPIQVTLIVCESKLIFADIRENLAWHTIRISGVKNYYGGKIAL